MNAKFVSGALDQPLIAKWNNIISDDDTYHQLLPSLFPCCSQALLCSCFVPGYCGMLPPSIKGVVSVWRPYQYQRLNISNIYSSHLSSKVNVWALVTSYSKDYSFFTPFQSSKIFDFDCWICDILKDEMLLRKFSYPQAKKMNNMMHCCGFDCSTVFKVVLKPKHLHATHMNVAVICIQKYQIMIVKHW